jgi:hypothetical protein
MLRHAADLHLDRKQQVAGAGELQVSIRQAFSYAEAKLQKAKANKLQKAKANKLQKAKACKPQAAKAKEDERHAAPHPP